MKTKQIYQTPNTKVVQTLSGDRLMWALGGSGSHGETTAPARAINY